MKIASRTPCRAPSPAVVFLLARRARVPRGESAASRDNKVLLSLRIAKARKEQRRNRLLQEHRPAAEAPPSGYRPSPVIRTMTFGFFPGRTRHVLRLVHAERLVHEAQPMLPHREADVGQRGVPQEPRARGTPWPTGSPGSPPPCPGAVRAPRGRYRLSPARSTERACSRTLPGTRTIPLPPIGQQVDAGGRPADRLAVSRAGSRRPPGPSRSGRTAAPAGARKASQRAGACTRPESGSAGRRKRRGGQRAMRAGGGDRRGCPRIRGALSHPQVDAAGGQRGDRRGRAGLRLPASGFRTAAAAPAPSKGRDRDPGRATAPSPPPPHRGKGRSRKRQAPRRSARSGPSRGQRRQEIARAPEPLRRVRGEPLPDDAGGRLPASRGNSSAPASKPRMRSSTFSVSLPSNRRRPRSSSAAIDRGGEQVRRGRRRLPPGPLGRKVGGLPRPDVPRLVRHARRRATPRNRPASRRPCARAGCSRGSRPGG